MGLQIHTSKTETMSNGTQVVFQVNNVKLPRVDRFEYLGSYVSRDCMMNEEIHVRTHQISTSPHREMQSIRFILASFGLAPAEGMNNQTLNILYRHNLWPCRIRKTEEVLWGTKTGNVFPEPMQCHKPWRVSFYKNITIHKKENKC